MKKIISLSISLSSAFFLYSVESIKLPSPVEAIENYRVPKIQEEINVSVVSEEKKNEEGSLPSLEKDLSPQEVFIQELNEKKDDLKVVPTIQQESQNKSEEVEEVIMLSENKGVESQESAPVEYVKENEIKIEKALINEEVTEKKAPSDDGEEEKSEEPPESNIPICPSSTTESLKESTIPSGSEVIQAPLSEQEEACEESETLEEHTKDFEDQEDSACESEEEDDEEERFEEKAPAQLGETPHQSESNETQVTSPEQDQIIAPEPEEKLEEKQPEEKKVPQQQSSSSVPHKIEVTSQPVIPYQGPKASFETPFYSNVPSYPTQTYVYPSSPVYYSEPSPCEPIYPEMSCYYPCFSLLEKCWTLEFRLGYFRPDSSQMRDTFDGGLDYEFEVTKSLCFDCMKLWANLNYYTKEGRESFLSDSTRVKLINLSAGLKYFYNVWDSVDLYAGAGIDWAFARFNDHSPLVIPHTTNNNVGFVAKAGAVYNFCECFFIDLFFDYYAQENLDFGSNPNLARRSIDISGFRTGAGIGVAF